MVRQRLSFFNEVAEFDSQHLGEHSECLPKRSPAGLRSSDCSQAHARPIREFRLGKFVGTAVPAQYPAEVVWVQRHFLFTMPGT